MPANSIEAHESFGLELAKRNAALVGAFRTQMMGLVQTIGNLIPDGDVLDVCDALAVAQVLYAATAGLERGGEPHRQRHGRRTADVNSVGLQAGDAMKTKPTKPNWKRLARAAAEDANTSCFSSRRGIFEYDDKPDIIAIYDNHPYAGDPARRPREHAKLREYLDVRGIGVLAHAVYPTRGEEAGYTTAMILGPLRSDVDVRWVRRAWEAILVGRDFDPRGPLDQMADATSRNDEV